MMVCEKRKRDEVEGAVYCEKRRKNQNLSTYKEIMPICEDLETTSSKIEDFLTLEEALSFLNNFEGYQFKVLSHNTKRGTFNFQSSTKILLILKDGRSYQAEGNAIMLVSSWNTEKWTLTQKKSFIDAQISVTNVLKNVLYEAPFDVQKNNCLDLGYRSCTLA